MPGVKHKPKVLYYNINLLCTGNNMNIYYTYAVISYTIKDCFKLYEVETPVEYQCLRFVNILRANERFQTINIFKYLVRLPNADTAPVGSTDVYAATKLS